MTDSSNESGPGPEYSETRLNGYTVGAAIIEARTALLPKRIAEDPLTNWMLRWDPLSRRDSRGRPGDSRGRPIAPSLFEILVAVIIGRKIDFYFETLFRIGRQWNCAETALSDCASLGDGENLAKSARRLEEALREGVRVQMERYYPQDMGVDSYGRIFLSYGEVRALLEGLRHEAMIRHTSDLEIAVYWWVIWKEEVSRYSETVDAEIVRSDSRAVAFSPTVVSVRARYNPLMALCYLGYLSLRRSRLRRQLKRRGADFGTDMAMRAERVAAIARRRRQEARPPEDEPPAPMAAA